MKHILQTLDWSTAKSQSPFFPPKIADSLKPIDLPKCISIALLVLLFARPGFGQAFITTWETTLPNQFVIIPTEGTGYNYDVDWGDGNVSLNQTGFAFNQYATADTYTITITGDFPRIFINSSGAKDQIRTIEQWGNNPWTSMASAFAGASNLTINATDAPDLSGVTDMSNMFLNASINEDLSSWDVSNVTNMMQMFAAADNFNGNISNWDVSSVTNMEGMFRLADVFNGDLSNWNVSSVEDMTSMFLDATSFDSNISGWNTSSVTTMRQMFFGATSFNRDLSSWDVSSVEDMSIMFSGASSFNGDVSGWNVSSVEDMSSMFSGASSFNGDVSGWNVSSVTDMSSMFSGATSFNGDVTGWNVSSVTDMGSMFSGATSFNGDVTGWNVSSVTNMQSMFRNATSFDQDLSGWNVSMVSTMSSIFLGATSFNGNVSNWNVSSGPSMNNMFRNATSFDQDLSGWNVSMVSNMTGMFQGATSFNGNVSSWNVSSVSTMTSMFRNATSFDQDLGAWDISGVTNLNNFLNAAGLSLTNYDNSLIGWNSQGITNKSMGVQGLSYCNGETARANLITNGWAFTGDMLNCPLCGGGGMAGLWVGCDMDGDWTNASNWDDGNVPGSGVDVTINNGDAVTIPSGTQSVKSINLDGSSTLTVSNGSTLSVTAATQHGIEINANSELVNEGTVNVSNVGDTGIRNIGTVTNNAGGAITSSGNSNNGFANGGGALATNAGQMTLTNNTADGLQISTNANTFTNSGTLTVSNNSASALDINGGTQTNSGTIQVDGTVDGLTSIGGNLAPGTSPGTATINNGFDISTATLEIEVNGTTANTEFDVLAVSGTATLGGTLSASFGYTPANGDRIAFLTANTVSGTFSTISPALSAGWAVEYAVDKVELVFTTPCGGGGTPGLWVGCAGDGLWTTASNWDDGNVPGSSVEVTILNGDVVTISSGNQTVKSINLDGSSTLTVNNGSTLSVTSSNGLGIDINSGTTLINNGSINISSSGTNGFAINGLLTNNANGIINSSGNSNNGLNINSGGSASNAGQITLANNTVDGLQMGSSSNTFNNSGTLTISGNNGEDIDYNGGTLTNSGTVQIDGNIDGLTSIGGSLAPGTSPGTATINNGFDISTATLEIEVDGTTANTEFDVLAVTGTATLGGTLSTSFGYTPANGDRIAFLTANTVSGTFSTISPALPSGWAVEYAADKVELVFTTPCGGGGTPGLWVGCAGDGLWTTASNWDDGNVPGSSVEVTISNGDAVSIPSGTQTVKRVALNNSSSLTVASGATLNVDGSTGLGLFSNDAGSTLNNNGTINVSNAGSSALFFNGSFNNNTGGVATSSSASVNGLGVSATGTVSNSGTITIIGAGNHGVLNANDFNNQAGGTLSISGSTANAFQNNGTVTNNGTLLGTGTYVLNGDNLDGTVSPGTSPGTMTFSGNQTFTASNTMTIEVDGTSPNTQHDVVTVGGTATISGTLNANINYSPSNGDRIEFLTATSVSGTFSTINPALPAGWAVEYSIDKAELVYTTPCGGGGTPGLWVGCASDGEWTTPSNWDDGNLPGSGVDVVIDNGDAVNILSGTQSVKSVTISNASSSLTVANGATLQVTNSTANSIDVKSGAGNFTNNGTVEISNSGNRGFVCHETLVNGTGATLNVSASTSDNIFITTSGTLENAGNITSTGGVNGIRSRNDFTNSANGQINISGHSNVGFLANDPGNTYANAGIITISDSGGTDFGVTNTSTFSNTGTLAGTGTFNLNGNDLDGTVSPGTSPGTMTFLSSQTFNASNTMEIEVDGTTPNTDYDVIAVTNTATISGTLDVNIGYTPSIGDRIVFLTATTAVSGTFSSDNLPADWFLDYSIPTQVSIFYAPAGTYAWDGDASDGEWSTPTNWNNDVVPPADADVEITNGDMVNLSSGTINIRALILSNVSDLTIANGVILTIGNSPSHGIEILVNGSELINNGTINIQSTLSGDGIHVNAATLTNGATGQININGIGTSHNAIELQSSTALFTNNGTVTIGSGVNSGVFMNSNGAKLVNNGTLTVTGTNNRGLDINNNGAEVENNGTINISGSGERGIRNLGTLTNNGSGIVSSNGNTSDGFQNANNAVLDNKGQLTLNNNTVDGLNTGINANTITNSGTLICSGNDGLGLDINGGTPTNSGMLKVNDGIDGLSSLGGTIAPGSSPGITNVTGSIDISTATLEMEVDGTGTAGTDYDRLTATGTITLGGTLNFVLGYVPSADDQITIITSGAAIVGTFSSDNLPANWFINYNLPNNGDVTLSFGASLPVEMVSFTAFEMEGTVKLDWVTASEKENRGFEVQRSLDGNNWQSIGFVEGAGTTLEQQNYQFIDERPMLATNYYRLKQMDFDGNSEFSLTVSVKLSGEANTINIFPNPVSTESQLNISIAQFLEESGSFTLFGLDGQMLSHKTISEQKATIDLGKLQAGIYILQVVINDRFFFEKLVVK